MPLVVGLTGGIGSGKTAAAERFAKHGIAVIDTDVIARELTAANGSAMAEIKQQFGDDYLNSDRALNRERMREKVFSDAAAKKKLEAILHPLIRAESLKRIAAATSSYVILAVPLLFETGGYDDIIKTSLVVDCPEATQISRTQRRSGMSEAQVRAIMAAQLSRAQRLKKAGGVIDNSAGLPQLDAEVDKWHQLFLAQAKNIL